MCWAAETQLHMGFGPAAGCSSLSQSIGYSADVHAFCAAWLSCRSLQAFDLRTKLYAGHISSVYRAVDRKSGITVGLKLYK
jgi:hypothetical protein